MDGQLGGTEAIPSLAEPAPISGLLGAPEGAILQESELESTVTGSRVFVSGEGASANSELRIESTVGNLYGVNALVWNAGPNSSQNLSINIGGGVQAIPETLAGGGADLSPSAALQPGQAVEGTLGSLP